MFARQALKKLKIIEEDGRILIGSNNLVATHN